MTDQTSTDEQQLEAGDASGPTPWSLGGAAPEPQKIVTPKPIDPKVVVPAHTHTGTDPLGRAIGPAEDHLDVKRVMRSDGEIVKPYTETVDEKGKVTRKTIDTRSAVKAATETAEATGTKPEAADEPTPYTPSEVAAAHERGDVLPPKEK